MGPLIRIRRRIPRWHPKQSCSVVDSSSTASLNLAAQFPSPVKSRMQHAHHSASRATDATHRCSRAFGRNDVFSERQLYQPRLQRCVGSDWPQTPVNPPSVAGATATDRNKAVVVGNCIGFEERDSTPVKWKVNTRISLHGYSKRANDVVHSSGRRLVKSGSVNHSFEYS